MNKKKVTFGIFAMMVLAVSLVSAFGVGSTFSTKEGQRLLMYPGETATVELYLQNMVGDIDYRFQANLRNDGGVAVLGHEDPVYSVPAKTRDVVVPVIVTIPEDAEVGEYFEFDTVFGQLQNEDMDEGMVQVVGGMNWRVGIDVVEEGQNTFYQAEEEQTIVTPEAKADYTLWYIILAIVIIVAILYFATRKKKK